MNIPFEKIEPFCITKKQQKNLEKLKKKFSIKNSANRETLSDLMDSLFICEKYEPLLASDNWGAFVSVFQKDNHKIGKKYTTHIEGNNTRLRHRIRRVVRWKEL